MRFLKSSRFTALIAGMLLAFGVTAGEHPGEKTGAEHPGEKTGAEHPGADKSDVPVDAAQEHPAADKANKNAGEHPANKKGKEHPGKSGGASEHPGE